MISTTIHGWLCSRLNEVRASRYCILQLKRGPRTALFSMTLCWKTVVMVQIQLFFSIPFIFCTRCLSTDPAKVEAIYAHLGLNL